MCRSGKAEQFADIDVGLFDGRKSPRDIGRDHDRAMKHRSAREISETRRTEAGVSSKETEVER